MHIFRYNEEEQCFSVEIEDKKVLIDTDKLELIYYSSNIRMNTWRIDENGRLYTFRNSKTKIHMVELIHDRKLKPNEWSFKNDNIYDLRHDNILINCNTIKPFKSLKTNENRGEKKMTFSFNSSENCFNMYVDDKTIFIDINKLEIPYFSGTIKSKTWTINERNEVITTGKHRNHIQLARLICGLKRSNYTYTFNNRNEYDYRHSNISYLRDPKQNTLLEPDLIDLKSHQETNLNSESNININQSNEDIYCKNQGPWTDHPPPSDITIKQYFQGHRRAIGKKARMMLNPYWLVENKALQEEEFYMMYCEIGAYTYFSKESFDKIIQPNKLTWSLATNGYIQTKIEDKTKGIYMHQMVTGFSGQKAQGNTDSVDHINRNKLDNRISNLRVVDQSTQNFNKDIMGRPLGGIPVNDSSLPKYIQLCKGANPDSKFDYFVIEGHPAFALLQEFNKDPYHRWFSSKSKYVNIKTKMTEALTELKRIEDLLIEYNQSINQ